MDKNISIVDDILTLEEVQAQNQAKDCKDCEDCGDCHCCIEDPC